MTAQELDGWSERDDTLDVVRTDEATLWSLLYFVSSFLLFFILI